MIGRADRRRRTGDLAVVFHALEPIGRPLGQAFLVGMHQVQDDDFPAAMAKQPDRREHLFEIVDQKVAHQKQHAAPASVLRTVAATRPPIALSAAWRGSRSLPATAARATPCRRAAPPAATVVEHGQAHLVLAPADDVRQRRRQVLRVLQLGAPGAAGQPAESHRARGVDRQRAHQIGFILINAGEGLARPPENLPIQPPQVFAPEYSRKSTNSPAPPCCREACRPL